MYKFKIKRKCDFCKIETKFLFNSKDFNREYSKITYTYNICKNCKNISLKNIPKKKTYLYQENFYNFKSKKNIWKDNQNKIKHLKEINFKKNQSLLEIGSGDGSFLYCCKKLGLNCEGLDINKKLNYYTKKRFGIKTIIKKNLTNLKKKYDIICAWHSIEHFENSKKVLEFIFRNLNKNGYIILAMPNPDAYGFRLFKEKWVHVDAPRHQNLINLNFLKKYLTKKNFKIILSTTSDDDAKYNDRLSWAFYICRIFSKKPLYAQSNYIKKLCHLIGLLLRFTFSFIENKNYRGSCYTLIAKLKKK